MCVECLWCVLGFAREHVLPSPVTRMVLFGPGDSWADCLEDIQGAGREETGGALRRQHQDHGHGGHCATSGWRRCIRHWRTTSCMEQRMIICIEQPDHKARSAEVRQLGSGATCRNRVGQVCWLECKVMSFISKCSCGNGVPELSHLANGTQRYCTGWGEGPVRLEGSRVLKTSLDSSHTFARVRENARCSACLGDIARAGPRRCQAR